MSDSNREQLSFIEEVTWGTTPSTPSMQQLRMTSESLVKNIRNIVSQEIRPDRQISDLIQAGKSASGDINFELSYGTYDSFIASALFSTWSTVVNVSATDIAADATGFTSSSTDFTTQNISVGMWIKVAGFTGNVANNTYYRVTSVTANDLNTSPAPAAVDAAGETVTIKGSCIRNGVTRKSLTIEKGFLDISEYFKFVGMVVSQFNIKVESDQIVTGAFSFLGKDATMSGTSLDATPVNATTTQIMNAIGNVGSIREGSVEIASPNYIKSLTMALNNNLRERTGVSSDSLVGIGTGKVDVTGTLSAYFGNSDIMDKFIAGSETAIDFRISDDLGNTYIFDMPRVKFDSGNVMAQGQDNDVFADMSYRALPDETYGFTAQICRFAA